MPIKVPISPLPVDGNHPSWTANIMINIIPTQNVGIEKPKIEPAIITLLALLSGLYPAYIPKGIAIIKDINNENKASSNVAGILWIINFRAGSPKINELPKSPLNAFTKKYQYCSVTGLSSPSSRITLSTSAWSASGLISISTGSPTRFTPPKTKRDIINKTSILWANLVQINAVILEFFNNKNQSKPALVLRL